MFDSLIKEGLTEQEQIDKIALAISPVVEIVRKKDAELYTSMIREWSEYFIERIRDNREEWDWGKFEQFIDIICQGITELSEAETNCEERARIKEETENSF